MSNNTRQPFSSKLCHQAGNCSLRMFSGSPCAFLNQCPFQRTLNIWMWRGRGASDWSVSLYLRNSAGRGGDGWAVGGRRSPDEKAGAVNTGMLLETIKSIISVAAPLPSIFSLLFESCEPFTCACHINHIWEDVLRSWDKSTIPSPFPIPLLLFAHFLTCQRGYK